MRRLIEEDKEKTHRESNFRCKRKGWMVLSAEENRMKSVRNKNPGFSLGLGFVCLFVFFFFVSLVLFVVVVAVVLFLL